MSTTMQVEESSVGRYYDPATGQFLSVDPLVDVTGQPYAYTGDDPVNAIDPDGLDCGIFSALCGAYDATAGGLKTAGAATYNGLETAGAAMLNGAQYAGAFLWNTAYALAGQPGPYCGIWGAEGTANIIDDTLLALDGGEGGNVNNAVDEEASEPIGPEEGLATTPAGRVYSSHYLNDTGPVRNIPGSVVDETIDQATQEIQLPDRTIYYDAKNDVTVVQSDTTGKIMSVRKGAP